MRNATLFSLASAAAIFATLAACGDSSETAGAAGSGAGADCPPTDQRGQPRKAACTLGAVEVP